MKVIVLALCLAITACASQQSSRHAANSGIIIDTQGLDRQRYQTDLADCRQYAEQVPTGQRTTMASVGGAVVGGALGAVVGNSDTAAKSAGVGAITGALGGYSDSRHEKRQIVRNCLVGRGYRVLN